MASSSRTIITDWQKYGHLVLDNSLGSLHRNNVDRLTARLDMTLIVLTGPLILKTKQMIDSDFILSCNYITATSPYSVGNFRKLSLYNCFMPI